MKRDVSAWKCDKCGHYIVDELFLGPECFHQICEKCSQNVHCEECPVCENKQPLMRVSIFGYGGSEGVDNSNNSNLTG